METVITVLWLVAIAIYIYGAWWFLRRVLGAEDRWTHWLVGMVLWACLGPFALVVIGVTT